ncbi:MAG: PAS domain-containing protein, partial [Oscillibacter sp.]
MKFKKSIVNIACLLIIFIMVAGTIWDFSIQMQRTLTSQTYRTLSDVSQDYNKAFLDRIAYNIRTMNVLAGSLQSQKDEPMEEIQRILQNAVEDGGFTEMVVCAPDGTSFSNEGLTVNLAHRDYFQKAMQGETNVSEPLISTVHKVETIVIAVPIYKQTTVVGVLFGTYPLATAGSQLLDFTYYSDGYGFIVSPIGDIILSSEHADKLCEEDNLFRFFEKTNLVEFSMAELQSTVAKGEGKSFTYTYGGERRFVSFMPSTVNNWYTFSVASDALMLQQRATTNRIVAQLTLKVIAVGLVLLAWIMMSSRRHNRELRIASQKYQSLLTNINGGVLVAVHAKTATETLVTYVSPGFTEMTGYTLEDIQALYHGRYLDMLLDGDRETAFQIYLEQIATGSTYRMPYRLRKKDGSFLWVMDNGYLVEDADGLRNHSIITDITAV